MGDASETRAVSRVSCDNEDWLRLALEAGAMDIWDWDLLTNEVYATENHLVLFQGVREGARRGYRDFVRRIHPEDRRGFENALWEARESGQTLNHEFRVVHSDGSQRWLSARGRYLYAENRKAVRLMALIADITERKHAEEALRESETRFRNMFETMTEGAAVYELVYCDSGRVVDYRLISANPAFERLTGISRGQAMGKTATWMFGTVVPPYLETFRQVAMGGPPVRFSAVIESLARQYEISAFSPSWGRFVTIFEDTTERSRLELREKKHQEDLLRAAGAITMGEMASAIAHELNQPLTAISSFSEGCLERMRGGQMTQDALCEALDEICSAARRASEVMRRVRQFMQKREFAPAPVALNDVIGKVVHFTETQRAQSGVRLQIDVPPDLPAVLADALLLEIVLLNLVRNGFDAMAATPSTQRVLRIAAHYDDAGLVHVAVIDRGSGVPELAQDSIFSAHVSSKQDGMGMGLAISRSIIESHGGWLTARSHSQGGAIFAFVLRGVIAGEDSC